MGGIKIKGRNLASVSPCLSVHHQSCCVPRQVFGSDSSCCHSEIKMNKGIKMNSQIKGRNLASVFINQSKKAIAYAMASASFWILWGCKTDYQ